MALLRRITSAFQKGFFNVPRVRLSASLTGNLLSMAHHEIHAWGLHLNVMRRVIEQSPKSKRLDRVK